MLMAALFMNACSTRPSVPHSFPDEDKMALIIADVYQTESVLSQTHLSYNSSNEDRVSGYYRFVLEQHGLAKRHLIRQWDGIRRILSFFPMCMNMR